MEFLKEHLGEELYSQVAEALKDKSLKLADLSTGEYTSKAKHDAELKKAKESIKELTDRVANFDGVDVEALKSAATTWETKYNEDMQKTTLNYEIEKALICTKAKNQKAVRSLLDNEKITFADGKVAGLQEQLEALRESDSYLFEIEQEKKATGVKHTNEPPQQTNDDPIRKAMGLK